MDVLCIAGSFDKIIILITFIVEQKNLPAGYLQKTCLRDIKLRFLALDMKC